MIVLLPLPFQSHINPMLRLGSILHANGFSITVAHSEFNPPNPSSHPHFSFLPLPDAVDVTLLDHSPNSFFRFLSDLNTKCMPQLLHRLPQLQNENNVACIIYDSMFYDAEATANQLGIPSLVLRICSATFSLVQTKLPDLISNGHLIIPTTQEDQDQIVPQLHPLRQSDLQILTNPDPKEALQLYSQMSKITTTRGIIFDTIDCLEQLSLEQLRGNYDVPIFTPGPFHKLAGPVSAAAGSMLWKENTDCLKWLDKQSPNSVLYVSIGSAIAIDVKEFVEMANALADCDQPFLWVVRPGSVIGISDVNEHLPEKMKKLVADETGCMVEWCPQVELLSHMAVGGFLTQCGWNSILEGICEGVPMICRAGWEDQVMAARYVCHEWGTGVELKGNSLLLPLKRGEIEKAIRKLMKSEEGKEMRKRAADLRSKVEIAIGEGGSSSTDLHALLDFISSFTS
ncbi:UDP-glucose iridoid glucosyltransferase-like [Impatiens glandulifera]|uniref:UDP-glucose iridoid glucosyltransferase-like n=1 Tax=Impatiens glandulifera TaxID=253017 RepID=UPI001FB06964|nr:UDP-glucose iridoid glucosyltransferase-like [Impatiens glandulifera]